MTTSLSTEKRTAALRRAAVRATLAPSIHNTQPWRFVLGRDSLEIHADWDRNLRVLDPRGRQLMISCGCAVFNARVALAAAGLDVQVDRFPDAARPHVIARLTVAGEAAEWSPISPLDAAIDVRRTNRRRFADEAVPAEVIYDLIHAAAEEGAELIAIDRLDHRLAVGRLSQRANRVEVDDPAYRAELRAWTSDDPRRLDGVPAAAAPYAGIGSQSSDAVPIRVFDTHGMGWLPADSSSGIDQCLLLLGSAEDGPAAWVAVGEALERVLLEIARRDYAASPLTQVIEVAATHQLLRSELHLTMHPSVLLRVGRAPATVQTRRRRLVDVIAEAD
jgi:hypothetical protein